MVSHQENNTRRIAALDERAETLGLKHGMGIADARAMHPAVEILEHDPEADRRLLEALADWCDRYTPLVAIEGKDGLFLDISGCAHLFGGEKRLLDEALSSFLHQGFDVRAGLASTAGAAWAAARFSLPPVEKGAEKQALLPLPLAALRLPAETRERVESVGLKKAGMLLSTPRAPLARRFGKELLLRIDQFLGGVEEPISPRLPVSPLSVERRLMEPVTMHGEIEHLVSLLAPTLKSDLERRGEGARALRLSLFRVDGFVSRIDVGTSRPLRDPALIRRLFQEKLAALEGTIDAGYGFDLIRLSASVTAPFEAAQADLSGENLAGENPDGEEEVAMLADRIRARLGDGAVLKPLCVESHIPERAVLQAPFAERLPSSSSTPSQFGGNVSILPQRPVRLFGHPEQVAVTAEVPEGPPLHFRWRNVTHRVARSEGPERIAPEWWLASGQEQTRDYYRVEDDDGHRYWIYREGFYGEKTSHPRWFLQGLFA
ncbi:MAG: Y-family DNA polymerase [Rhizobiaceae bacterium]